MWTAAEGDLIKVRSLITENADINAKGSSGKTALMYAISNGHKDIAVVLIEHGADTNAKEDSGYDPLLRAIMEKESEIVKVLLENGADANAKYDDGHTTLMEAAWLLVLRFTNNMI
jgi:ankyrin repeat protein